MGQNGSREDKDWRKLAEEASREADPAKLHRLVEELCAALDEREQSSNEKPDRDPGKVE